MFIWIFLFKTNLNKPASLQTNFPKFFQLNKVVIAGIIAVIAIGIGIAIAITSNFDLESTSDKSENITLESQEPESKEFKIELKEEIGLEAQP